MWPWLAASNRRSESAPTRAPVYLVYGFAKRTMAACRRIFSSITRSPFSTLTLASLKVSFFRTAKAFRVTWSKRKCEAKTKLLKSETAHAVVYKTSVSHFKINNTPLKDTEGKGKFKRITGSFLLVEKGRLSFTKLSFEEFEIHEIFITADRSVLLKRNQAAKFLNNFQVHFVLYSQENYVFKWQFIYLQIFLLRRFIHF